MSFFSQDYYICFSSINVNVRLTIPFQQLVANNYQDLPENIRELILSPIPRTIIYPQNPQNLQYIRDTISRPLFYLSYDDRNINELYCDDSDSDSDSDDDLPDLIDESDFTEDEDSNIDFYNDISRNIHINKKEYPLYTGYRRKKIGLE